MIRSRFVFFASIVSLLAFLSGCGGEMPASSGSTSISNPAPAVVSISPSSSVAGSPDTTVTIIGSGFVSSSTVQWNGAPVVTTLASSTMLSAVLPAASLSNGTIAKLTVVNPSPGGGTSPEVDFSVNNPTPTISKINPASILAGSGDTIVDISGTGFDPSSVIMWNGTPLATTFVSGTDVKVTLPAVDSAASLRGAFAIQNPAPGGGTSTSTTFNVNSPTPTIISVSPNGVPPGVAATITISGTGFESNSVAMWNGSARPTIFVSSTVLKVSLSAPDLQNQGTGLLSISNPDPGASTSSAAQIVVTTQPIPTIQNVSIAPGPVTPGACPQLRATITGLNFILVSAIQVNSIQIPVTFNILKNSTTIILPLPQNFVAAPGALSFTVSNAGSPAIVSNSFPYPTTNPSLLAICATPSPTAVFPGSSFSFTVQPAGVNIGGNVTLALGNLPTGITATSTIVALPATGAAFHLQAANSTTPAAYDLGLTAMAGTTTAQGDFNFTVSSGTIPILSFAGTSLRELGVPIGGSASMQFQSIESPSSFDFDVIPSVTGLPPGTSATFSPSVFSAGQTVTLTISAANNAPVTENATLMFVGTPSGPVASATSSFLADITQPPGSLPGNRTDFVAISGTPFAATYDATHELIFASNPNWNRVDVISNATHKIVKSIPIRSPRGLDINQSNSQVWVQTASPNVYSIDTTSLHARQYALPANTIGNGSGSLTNAHDRLLALADGTILLFFNDATGGGSGPQVGVWNPQTNQLTILASGLTSAFGLPSRSGDGTHVYASNVQYDTGVEVYDANTQTLTKLGAGTGFHTVVAVNGDGTRIVFGDSNQALNLYNNNLTMLGIVPGALTGFGVYFPPSGGYVFSRDSKRLYGIGSYNGLMDVLTIDASNLQVLGAAPEAAVEPVGTSGGVTTATPFAVDSTGIVLGLQTYGIAFDDSAFYQNYAANQPGSNETQEYIATFGGPLSGGTASSILSLPSQLTPDVWFGQTRGSVGSASGALTFTSPPSTTPGPANVKFIYPDGEQAFYPQLFAYSTFPEYSLLSGSSPDGGAPARILGYGLPQDPSAGTLTVGTQTATITTMKGQYPPFGGEPYPSTILNYNFPPGAPGWWNLQVTTPIGSGNLPKAVFYAKSVTDYSSSDSFTAVLVDEKRNRVYLSAGDHVDVFSTTSNAFLTPLEPAAQGSVKQFTGLALTPDGSSLLAADLPDGSLAVINPDAPFNTYAIPITNQKIGDNNCAFGPLYVAATSTNQAFVSLGSLPAPSCTQFGNVFIANLLARTAIQAPAPPCPGAPNVGCAGGLSVDATADGNFVGIGGGGIRTDPWIYSVQNSSYSVGPFPESRGYGITISGDGNVVGSNQDLTDLSMNLLGDVAQPTALYASLLSGTSPPTELLRPRLNASGSLYYFAYPHYFEIIDVAHALLRMRFSLTQTIQNTGSPLAIDSGGQHIYLLTDRGLTVVDLGAAPLSIGHMSQSTASPGTQITVRGSGFDSASTAAVGGISATINVTDQNTLTLTMPQVPSGPQDIVLTSGAGDSYTLENGVTAP
jgi:hypothetical protein